MDRYIARANIDHYLGLLNDPNVSAETRATITKLLITEEAKLDDDPTRLEFIEERATRGRDRLNHLRNLRHSFAAGSAELIQADQLIADLEALQHLLNHFCHKTSKR